MSGRNDIRMKIRVVNNNDLFYDVKDKNMNDYVDDDDDNEKKSTFSAFTFYLVKLLEIEFNRVVGLCFSIIAGDGRSTEPRTQQA